MDPKVALLLRFLAQNGKNIHVQSLTMYILDSFCVDLCQDIRFITFGWQKVTSILIRVRKDSKI